MEITKRHWAMVGVGFSIAVLVVTGILQLASSRGVEVPESVMPAAAVVEEIGSTTPPVVAEVRVTSTNRSAKEEPFAIAKGDTVAAWSFTGAYTNNPDLVVKAQTEIARLSSFIGTGIESDSNIFVGIANQYDLLGDGKQEYDYLKRAIEADGEITGLPWHNLGVLLEKLGALETARIAYQKSTLVQPHTKLWHTAYLEFLVLRMRDNVTDIEKAFAAALANLGQDSDILSLQSEWKTQ